ncbi:hypothetical protein [Streptomyces sp. AC550_RSS872]|uniref:hypothetical protein n=1 Tax=Streptomyces sp. AC550_RSS872 TaxID=2823689 RepID=UPI001C27C351|nr:hypothetical protein [Streptomyces sp. AC550_RSS872]
MDNDRDPLLSLRAAVVFALGGLVGIGAVLVTLWGGNGPDAAMLAGGTAFGGGVLFFHTVIG